ncbi:MAG TPA: VOC family protein [Bacteroidia bacterium]|jgi:predicted enzyme related to lactoylglutathione lyase|nr:VOC family protein [Bacteroidia bacterium]
MKKIAVLTIAIVASFSLGYAFNNIISKHNPNKEHVRKVTGIGGIFFKCKNPAKLRDWYKEHLGLVTNDYGSTFEWKQALDSTKKGFTEWSPFKDSTRYFEPSKKDFMINYRVVNLASLVADLKKEGVIITDTIQTADYGKFVHLLDLEGNGIELWEPNDEVYGTFPGGTTK